MANPQPQRAENKRPSTVRTKRVAAAGISNRSPIEEEQQQQQLPPPKQAKKGSPGGKGERKSRVVSFPRERS